jgi:alpha-L-fucosidase 2
LKLISNQLSPVGEHGGGTYTNLFDAHAPFQIDGNFGCTSGITEMLMQSHDGAIQLLPALPAEWKQGHVNGLRARGGFTITALEWKDGKVVKLKVLSTLGGNCRIRVPNALKGKGLVTANGDNSNPFYQVVEIAKPIVKDASKLMKVEIAPTQLYDLPTQKGKEYVLTI